MTSLHYFCTTHPNMNGIFNVGQKYPTNFDISVTGSLDSQNDELTVNVTTSGDFSSSSLYISEYNIVYCSIFEVALLESESELESEPEPDIELEIDVSVYNVDGVKEFEIGGYNSYNSLSDDNKTIFDTLLRNVQDNHYIYEFSFVNNTNINFDINLHDINNIEDIHVQISEKENYN